MPRRPCGSTAGWSAEALKTAPSTYTLTPRNPARTVHLGGDTINFTLVAGPPNVHDMERGRRAGNLARLPATSSGWRSISTASTCSATRSARRSSCRPIQRHLDTYFANLTLTDKSFHVSAIGRGRALDGIAMMAIARGLTLDADARRSRRHHHHLGQLAAPLRRHDGRGPDDHGRARPVGRGDAVHADGRDEPGDAGRRAGAAECRGAVRHRADAAGAARRAGDVRRLHLQCRHALGRAGLRHAGKHQGQRRVRPARAALQSALPHDARLAPPTPPTRRAPTRR